MQHTFKQLQLRHSHFYSRVLKNHVVNRATSVGLNIHLNRRAIQSQSRVPHCSVLVLRTSDARLLLHTAASLTVDSSEPLSQSTESALTLTGTQGAYRDTSDSQ